MANENEEFEFRARAEREANNGIAQDVIKHTGMGNRIGQVISAVGEVPYKAGQMVSNFVSNAGGSPETAGGLGYGTNVALQSIPMLVGGEAAKSLAVPLRDISKGLMQSALKPTIAQLRSGEAATAIDTMLSQGINATKGGVEKIRSKINDLNDQIKQAIAESPETVNKGEVGRTLYDTFEKFKNQVNPQGDLEAIKKAWMEFRNHPMLRGIQEFPVQLAQELKQGTYSILAKKYGQVGTAETEAQKALARGLKDQIAEKVPAVAAMNAEESALIKTLNVTERRALMDLNKNPGGLAWLAGNPASFTAFMADKSALFKSLAARMINSGAEQIPANAARAGVALSEIGTQVGQPVY